ncbi:MAG: PIN domain-containing protein, partial [Chloroflexota bacterium]|nr:PIN domain-containing protein [Chloroflexota bacterium]
MFYAALDRSDAAHGRARAVLATQEPLVTTDHVVVETWLLAQRRLGATSANGFWGGIRAGAVNIESVGSADVDAAWLVGEQFRDQAFSIVDCTSFAVMVRLGLQRAAALDKDFAIFRFGPRRDRAFEIVG